MYSTYIPLHRMYSFKIFQMIRCVCKLNFNAIWFNKIINLYILWVKHYEKFYIDIKFHGDFVFWLFSRWILCFHLNFNISIWEMASQTVIISNQIPVRLLHDLWQLCPVMLCVVNKGCRMYQLFISYWYTYTQNTLIRCCIFHLPLWVQRIIN